MRMRYCVFTFVLGVLLASSNAFAEPLCSVSVPLSSAQEAALDAKIATLQAEMLEQKKSEAKLHIKLKLSETQRDAIVAACPGFDESTFVVSEVLDAQGGVGGVLGAQGGVGGVLGAQGGVGGVLGLVVQETAEGVFRIKLGTKP